MKRVAVIGNPGSWSTEKLADAFAAKTGFRRVVDMSQVHMDLDSGRMWHDGEELSAFDALTVKKIGPTYSPDMQDRLSLLDLLARKGTPIFSNPASILAALNRLSCTVILRAGNMPMPPTRITEHVEAAVEAVERFGRAVFKPLYTSKARGMEVISADPSCRERIIRFQNQGNPVMYIQKMLDTPGKDLGIVFLGGDYLGTYARQSAGAWNTSTSSGGKYANHDPSQEVLDLAWKAQNLFDLDFTCVDVMETDAGPMIFEVSAFGGFRGLLEARGLDASVRFADYVLKQVAS
ncbi:MAG: GAK system ATP-grasp enzyme [Desulfovibrionales bacterium]|nr:MAG: GAK system ATP-grasp enzyme [Desulfovibrionales bacterium]